MVLQKFISREYTTLTHVANSVKIRSVVGTLDLDKDKENLYKKLFLGSGDLNGIIPTETQKKVVVRLLTYFIQ